MSFLNILGDDTNRDPLFHDNLNLARRGRGDL